MKRLHTLLSVCVASLACVGAILASPEGESLKLHATVVTGERSRDSSSETTRITVEGDSIKWEQSATGGHRPEGVAPKEKEFKLLPAETGALLKLIRDNGLLTTDSLMLPLRPPVFYFDLMIETTVGDEKGAVKISGPRSATELRENALFRHSLLVLKELYRIIHEHDKSLGLDELVRERQ